MTNMTITITIPVDMADKVKVEQTKTVAAAKRGRGRYHREAGTTCQKLILDALSNPRVLSTPKGLARYTGYKLQTVYSAINLLKAEGYDIRKEEGRGGKYKLMHWSKNYGS